MAVGYIDDLDRLNVELKGPQDFVSAADRAVEHLIIDRLSAMFPGDAFLGEESHGHGDIGGAALWVIDPIRATLAGSLVGLESSFRGGPAAHVGMMRGTFAHGGEYRRYGSAALGLVLVAEGRLDAFAEIHLNAWDVAAGIVLGGWTNDFFGGNGLRDGGPMFAACPGVRDAFAQIADSAES